MTTKNHKNPNPLRQTKPKNKGGRPKGSVKSEVEKTFRAFVNTKTEERAEEIVQAMFDLALGHKELRTIKINQEMKREEVYTVPPNGQMLRYLIDRHLGKPKESIETNQPLTFVEVCRILLHDTD